MRKGERFTLPAPKGGPTWVRMSIPTDMSSNPSRDTLVDPLAEEPVRGESFSLCLRIVRKFLEKMPPITARACTIELIIRAIVWSMALRPWRNREVAKSSELESAKFALFTDKAEYPVLRPFTQAFCGVGGAVSTTFGLGTCSFNSLHLMQTSAPR